MSDEILYDKELESRLLRCHVSDCFNHREDYTADSGYMRLAKLMQEKYGLHHYDVDHVVDDIEELVAQYIMEQSPKFNDDAEE